jgi:hypothetical protein
VPSAPFSQFSRSVNCRNSHTDPEFLTPSFACFGGLRTLTADASFGFARSRSDAPASRLDVVLPVSSASGFVFGRKQEFSQVHRVPFSCTFAVVLDPGGTLGDSAICCSPPHARSSLGQRRGLLTTETFVARSHSFGARCQRLLRFALPFGAACGRLSPLRSGSCQPRN